MITIVSWNLLRRTGASLDEVVDLARRERPDLLLLQEATTAMDRLPAALGGFYARAPLPGAWGHGLAVWSPHTLRAPRILRLPSGAVVQRHCQIVALGGIGVANVHLSHGQMLNRRQLRTIARALPEHAAMLGDYNLVGPALVPGFVDVGPRAPTHVCADLVPLRLDRCLVRGLACIRAEALDRASSDHRPISVRLVPVAARTPDWQDTARAPDWRDAA
jgi:endonuclease/exonuclease/phosphatase (EEP) superfamily protein YafD